MEETVDGNKMSTSLKKIDDLYSKEGLNYESKFGFLRKTHMKFPDMSPLAIFRGTKKYAGSKQVIHDFEKVYMESQTASSKVSAPASSSSGQKLEAEIKIKTLMVSQGARFTHR